MEICEKFWAAVPGRPPHGGRGLKCIQSYCQAVSISSPSSRRAWIEIISGFRQCRNGHRSPSSRRAWIEIMNSCRCLCRADVALLTEGVD